MREISSIEFETIEPLEKLFSGFSAFQMTLTNSGTRFLLKPRPEENGG